MAIPTYFIDYIILVTLYWWLCNAATITPAATEYLYSLAFLYCATAVSYTHLDVYKRQYQVKEKL